MPTKKNKDITRIVNRVNKSSADFVNRLKDPNRISIPDWEDSRYIATHKLGVGTDNNGQVFIYPSVQNINGKLVDFTNPKFGEWDGIDSAIERRDTVHVDNIQDGLDFTENYKRYYPTGKTFKCGGRRKAQLGLDIQYGGRAIPIGRNMVYFDGNSHENGGIGVGNKLEVEGGEVGEYKNNTLRVFSSVPFLRGVSPAQLVMGGANPNKVFKAQENFKDRNRINDDGTTYELGGNRIYTPSKAIQKQLQETGKVTIGGAPTIGGLKTYKYLRALTNIRKYGDIGTNIFRAGKEVIKRGTQKLVDSGKISKEVAQVPRSIYAQFVGGYGQNLPKTISLINNNMEEKKAGGIYIKPSKRGTFTAAASKRGMGVQEFANKVLANREDYSPAMVKKANFARNASHWKKEFGGSMLYTINGNVKNGLMSARPKAQYGTIKRHGKTWKWDEEYGAYVPVKDSKEKEPINVNKQTKSSVSNNKKTNYTINGTFDNARPQYYAEKRLPVAGSQSIAEKAGLARSGWSYADSPTLDYVPKIDISVPTNYAKAVDDNAKINTSSTPRGRGTKSSKPATSTKPATVEAKQPKLVERPKENLYITGIKNNAVKSPIMIGMEKISANPASPSTGGETQPKDGRWVGQYKTTNVGDWIGLGANIAGTIGSYFINKSSINKMPMPIKPVMAQAAKLKTRYNINPQLTEIREGEQMNRASVRRNTQSSSSSLAREQRLMNEARGARNTLYGQKENIETQLINQDRLNRQSVNMQNVRSYNEYLNRLTAAKMAQNEAKISNVNNLIYGLTGSVNSILGNIESRRATNNTIRAMAAANPNVDARLIGGFDYYIDPITKKKYNKNQQLVGTING